MVFRQLIRLSLTALFVSAALPGISQVAPAATQRSLPLEIGGGLSYFSTHAANSNPTIDYTAFDGRPAWSGGMGRLDLASYSAAVIRTGD